MQHQDEFRTGDRVEFTGPDDSNQVDPLWSGHPGRVIDHDDPDGTVTVDFVAKGSECVSAEALAQLTEDEYQRRAQRLIEFTHPLRDENVGWGPLQDRNYVP